MFIVIFVWLYKHIKKKRNNNNKFSDEISNRHTTQQCTIKLSVLWLLVGELIGFILFMISRKSQKVVGFVVYLISRKVACVDNTHT